MELKVGQVWKQVSPAVDYGDIQRWQIVFVKGINAVAVNCATLTQIVICGEDQINSFTFDCELTDEKPRLDGYTLKSIGY
jgi:hypothetical protein